jgi:hypothetical protein
LRRCFSSGSRSGSEGPFWAEVSVTVSDKNRRVAAVFSIFEKLFFVFMALIIINAKRQKMIFVRKSGGLDIYQEGRAFWPIP